MSKPAERNVHNADTPDFSVPDDGPRHTDLQHDWHPARRLPDRQTNHGSLAGHLRGGVGRVRTHAAEDQPSANRHFPSFAAVADAPISK